jgi:2-hydroxy-3-keto-5-methylthiopentenyl-1-phosphate phosphatase
MYYINRRQLPSTPLYTWGNKMYTTDPVSQVNTAPFVPETDDLFIYGPDALDKLEALQRNDPPLLSVVGDWDHTFTRISTWAHLRPHMSTPEKQDRHRELFEYYHPKEVAGTLTPEEAATWQSETLGLLIGASFRNIEASLLAGTRLRLGVRRLFETCNEHGIPVVVKSAGIKNAIAVVSAKHRIHPAAVFANELILDNNEARTVLGWDRATLTHALNKGQLSNGHPVGALGTVMLFGDGLLDANMVHGPNVIKFRVPGRAAEVQQEHYVPQSLEVGYDIVLRESNLLAAAAIMRQIVGLAA